MQKKSLLVALFCGALCLTGCIKNEESASVAQVRIAKANELNSIADLNKAKAAAEAVYAQAELTLAQAEAELKKAEAALKNAEAATEKVRAELLEVEVKLAEVKVEEEKVKLQMMEADLEARLAALEAEKAAAAAAKQAWINVLDQLLAENEIAAIENAHAIYEAQAQLDSCILATEGAKADSAKVYAAKYFQALDTVAKLQTQIIEAKVSRVLIERGAMDTRDYIYQQIDAKNEQIEENNARIAELKKYQTMDADEAEAKLEEARLALNEVYNIYMDAVTVEQALADALNGNAEKQITGLKNMTPDYTQDWKTEFKDEFKTYVNGRSGASEVYFGDHSDVDGVQYYGVFVADEDDDDENDAFIPLWTTLGSYPNYSNWADVKTTTERYPNIDVYEGENTDFIKLTNTTYVPAKIEFDNVKEVIDGLVAEAKEAVEADNKRFEEKIMPALAKRIDAEIAEINDTLPLHKAYVDEREPGITEIEEAYFEALKTDSLSKQAKKDAWNAFQNYMLKKYSDVSRAAFELRWEMQEKDAKAASDTVTANGKLALAKQGVTLLEGELASAIEAEAKAEGAWRKAVDDWAADPANAAALANWEDWQKYYNPKFDYAGKIIEVSPDPSGLRSKAYFNADANDQPIEGTKAGIRYQDDLAVAILELQAAEKDVEDAQEEYWRGHIDETTYQHIIGERDAKQAAVDALKTKVSDDAQKYTNAKNAYATASADLKDAAEAWNEDYSRNWADEHDGDTDHKYKKVGKVMAWVDAGGYEAGTAQAARDTAWALLVKAQKQLKVNHEYDYDHPAPATATVAEKALYAKNVSDYWHAKLADANQALFAPLGVTKAEDIKDAEAKALYAAYVAAETTNEAEELKDTLLNHLYGRFNPDYIADLDNDPEAGNGRYDERFPENQKTQYGWLISSYHVDYEAQMIDFETNEYVSIASQIFPGEYLEDRKGDYVYDENGDPLPNYAHSLAFQKEQLEAFKEKIPSFVAKHKENNAQELKTTTDDLQKLANKINAYKAHETNYLAWIESLNTAEVALNEAKKAEFDAKQDYEVALAVYKALDAVANEGMWVCFGLDDDGEPIWSKLNIADSIKYFEDQNKTLENDIEDLKQLLKDGKVAFQLVNQMIDEWLVVLDERLEIWLAIANQYKVIMNGYLGIVEDVDVEPVVEGDEE